MPSATAGQPGKAYPLCLTLDEINQLLPSRSDDSLATIQDADRALAPRPAANIRRYRAETDNWIPGATTLAISPEAIAYSDGTLTIRSASSTGTTTAGPSPTRWPAKARPTPIPDSCAMPSPAWI